MQISPAVEHGQDATRTASTPSLAQLRAPIAAGRLIQRIRAMDVATCGKYSIERLEGLRHYSSTTSLLHAVMVCVATPLPALATTLLLESIPLQPPRAGWRANWGFWTRIALSVFTISLLGTCHMVAMVAPLRLSLARRIAIATGTACCYVAFFLVLADVVGFPVPMMWQLGVVPAAVAFPLTLALAMGKTAVFTPSVTREHVGRYLVFFAAHMALLGLYPLYMALYDSFPPRYQLAALLVLPLWRAASRLAVVRVCRHAEDLLPELVAFVVDVFDSLFLSVCLQNATTVASLALVLGIDGVHSAWTVHDIKSSAGRVVAFLRGAKLHQERDQHGRPVNLLDLLAAMAGDPAAFEIDTLSGVRLWAFLPHRIPSAVSRRLTRLEKLAVYRGGRASLSLPATTSMVVGPSRTALQSRSILPVPSIPTTKKPQSSTDSETSPVRKIGAVTVPDVRGPAAKLLLVQGLQLLFYCEYVLLVEYVECVIPAVYVAYVSVVSWLPNVVYYPPHPAQHVGASVYALAYPVLEVVSLVVLSGILRRKFRFSPIFQLAFVLETQAVQVQAMLFLGVVCLLQFKLEHLDFSFHFDWLRR